MADRRTKKTAKQIFGYARLNFHMGMRQGKNLAVLLCMGCFLLYYLGGIRGYLASAEETVSVQELFLAMMNTHYTAMTVWVGYLLVICDIPYSEKGIYPYLIRTSRKSWLLGQILYLFLVTIFYFFYVGLVLAAAIVPHISFRISWTNAFVKMLNAPWRCGIKNYFSFTFSLIKHNSQYVVVVRQLFLYGALPRTRRCRPAYARFGVAADGRYPVNSGAACLSAAPPVDFRFFPSSAL